MRPARASLGATAPVPSSGYDPCQRDSDDDAAPLWIMDLPWAPGPNEPPDQPEEISPLAAYAVGTPRRTSAARPEVVQFLGGAYAVPE